MSSFEIPFRRVSIVGTGLIGGSWGLALKRRGFMGVRIGCDQEKELQRALAAGAIDQGEEDFSRAIHGSDLVILAVPVGAILHLIDELRSAASMDALVTDTGSTKAVICEKAARILHGKPKFLGGHPLAGKERSGVENADANLFNGSSYVLTPENPADLEDERVKAFYSLVASFGARPFVMDAASHDDALASLSHLPQVLSTALASLIWEDPTLPLNLAASGFRDVTRLAESPYSLWRDVCMTNHDNIQRALDALISKLETLKNHLVDDSLRREFEQAQKLRQKLLG